MRGFEPPAPASRTQCSTRLSYTPAKAAHIALGVASGKALLQSRRRGGRPAMQMRQVAEQRGYVIHHLIEAARRGIGETGGDAVTMSWLGETTAEAKGTGYLIGTAIFGERSRKKQL